MPTSEFALIDRYFATQRRQRPDVALGIGDAPVVFLLVFASFVLMTLRSVQVFIGNLKRGYSVLERPGAFDGSTEG